MLDGLSDVKAPVKKSAMLPLGSTRSMEGVLQRHGCAVLLPGELQEPPHPGGSPVEDKFHQGSWGTRRRAQISHELCVRRGAREFATPATAAARPSIRRRSAPPTQDERDF